VGDEVQNAAAVLAAALARGDAAAAASLYADDGRLLTSAAELLSGRSEIEAYWQAGIAFGLSSLDLQMIELSVGDRVAIEIGRYALAVDGGGGAAPVSEHGKYVALHRRQADGAWRRAVDVFNAQTRKEER
jgi:uncharacterized protein (TIGR02246 family)